MKLPLKAQQSALDQKATIELKRLQLENGLGVIKQSLLSS
jgi:hypothetical protein